MKVTILGCGNSTGVPAIGNFWGACDPSEPKNARTRSSLAIQTEGTTLIIDTGPDFRTQMNRENITALDGVFYTHFHGDHVGGVDELRILGMRAKKHIPVYGDVETLADLKKRFYYLFDGGAHEVFYPPVLEGREISAAAFGQPHMFRDIEFIPFVQDHGTCASVGYRFGTLAYSVDLVNLDSAAIDVLKGVETWIVDGAAYHQTNNPVHANLETIYRLAREIKARRVILTSLSLAMDYETLRRELLEGFEPAYDGLCFEV